MISSAKADRRLQAGPNTLLIDVHVAADTPATGAAPGAAAISHDGGAGAQPAARAGSWSISRAR